MIKGLEITPLNIIQTPGGDVMHAMKKSDAGFVQFGEAYFSNIEYQAVKAWKRHHSMTLNLVVPVGRVKFVILDDRMQDKPELQEVIISMENYCRITIPPMVWLGFQGLSKGNSVLLNIADMEHDPEEVDRKTITQIDYDWRLN